MSGMEELRAWCERQRNATLAAGADALANGFTHCAANAQGMADAYDATIHHIDQLKETQA